MRLLLPLLALAACVPTAPTCADPTEPRPFQLGSTGVSLMLGEDPLYGQTELPALDDVDVVVIHEDYLGVPWEAFAAGEPPPAAWVEAIDVMADNARASGKPVLLSVALVNQGRTHLAHRASEVDGELIVETGWSGECYDFGTATDADALRRAYVAYVRWMVDRFEPTWLNHAPEVNLFAACGAGPWASLVEVANETYEAVKADRPDLVVFPSFQVEHLRGLPDEACFDGESRGACETRHLDEIGGLRRDRFAVSTYPYSEWTDPRNVPEDHVSGLVPAGETLVFAETGWISERIRARDGEVCRTLVRASPERAGAWLGRVLETADEVDADLVVWWSDRDLLDQGVSESCPCDPASGHCETLEVFRGAFGEDNAVFGELVYKAYGTMGLRHADGSPKEELLTCWSSHLARELR